MNILLVVADALRRDHMGCYGYHKNTTPIIDRLASEGVRFSDCASVSSHTAPPTFSIVTGEDGITHGIMTAQQYGQWMKDNPWKDKRTPLRFLAEQGYLVDGDLVKRWGPLGFSRDYEDLTAYMHENRDRKWFYLAQPYPTHLPYNPPDDYYREFIDPAYTPSEDSQARFDVIGKTLICHPTGLTAAEETDQEEAILDDEMDEAHKRTVASVDFEPEDAPGIRALYDGEMRVFDDWVAGHLETLRSLGLLDDTLIILMSDHGEELMERGHVGHSSANLVGTLYDEVVMVPLIMWHATAFPKGRVVEGLVSVMDIMPTIYDILGLDLPGPVDGHSMLPKARGEAAAEREEVYAEVPPAGWQRLIDDERRIRMIRTMDSKLIWNLDLAGAEESFEFYDLNSDPGERNDIYDTGDKFMGALKKKLMSHFNAHD